MGEMFRSELMTLCDIFIQPEAAFEILSQLGEIGCVQFVDLNSDLQLFQRSYVTEVCRFSEIARKLRFFESLMKDNKIKIPYEGHKMPKPMHPSEVFGFETESDKWEHDMIEITNNYKSLLKTLMELKEMDYILDTIGPLFGSNDTKKDTKLKQGKSHLPSHFLQQGHLFIKAGVVNRHRCFPFEMMLWRISRGNIYYRQASEDKMIKDPKTGRDIRKVAFLAICQGEELSSRMLKVCTGFRVHLYPCPTLYNEMMDLSSKITTRITDLEQVIKKTKYQICKNLRDISKKWYWWMIRVKMSKAIYHTMNRFNFDITKKCLIGQCWIPNKDLTTVQDILKNTSKELGTNVRSFLSRRISDDTPPTYHRTNKFTFGFQTLINAYGNSTYRELNPGLYTIVTFPFLFSIMFGDLGHGLMIIIFASWMLINEKKFMATLSSNEIWNIFFGGRYIILFLGLFSMFAGFIFNDFFSKSLYLMNPSWIAQIKDVPISKKYIFEHQLVNVDPVYGRPYPMGIDPIWTIASNHIMVENSIKMKISIIFGITHMFFGIMLSLVNYIYFKERYKIFLQFLPEIFFLTCLFMWLVFMIYFKWLVFSPFNEGKKNANCAPNILILFIDMVLGSTSKPVEEDCDAYMFSGQAMLQNALVLISAICIPVMLLGPPICRYKHHQKMKAIAMEAVSKFRGYRKDAEAPNEEKALAEIAKHSVPFSDLLIGQGVHTIEFVLSTISHTASYLRLWALSLAHTSLSDMLWNMVLSNLGLQNRSSVAGIYIFVAFFVWAIFTVAILVVMEGLSAFLHTLRLHWVEFMSKFYSGGGWLFQPFSFHDVLTLDEEKTLSACKKIVTIQDLDTD